jgi:LPXTG-site transpeptidase (sortase) family protein
MRLVIINNWSILLGFLITSLAFTGMVLAVFFPDVIAIDLTPERSISALEVPLKRLEPAAAESDLNLTAESDTFSAARDTSIREQDAPQPVRSKPQSRAEDNQNDLQVAAPIPETGAPQVISEPSPGVPRRILIPSIQLDAPVVAAPVDFETIAGEQYLHWFVPDEFAVGWHTTSAMLGETGNTVLNGHHNAHGEVFVSLVDVKEGDVIWVESDHRRYRYQVANKMILPEKYEQLDVRMSNAQWILPTVDERLTLITCWPYESNTHRLIIVARPLGEEAITLNLE